MIDFSKVPGEVTIKNNGDKGVKILSQPQSTQGFTLAAGETVKIKAEHSYELISFYAQGAANSDLEVTLPTTTL